jgi:hypothetical protein
MSAIWLATLGLSNIIGKTVMTKETFEVILKEIEELREELGHDTLGHAAADYVAELFFTLESHFFGMKNKEGEKDLEELLYEFRKKMKALFNLTESGTWVNPYNGKHSTPGIF